MIKRWSVSLLLPGLRDFWRPYLDVTRRGGFPRPLSNKNLIGYMKQRSTLPGARRRGRRPTLLGLGRKPLSQKARRPADAKTAISLVALRI